MVPSEPSPEPPSLFQGQIVGRPYKLERSRVLKELLVIP